MTSIAPQVAARLRRDLATVAARIGFQAEQHVRDVLDAAARAMEHRCREDLETYVADLVTGRESADPWIEEIVVQETYFFRDLVQLDWIGRSILGPLAFPVRQTSPSGPSPGAPVGSPSERPFRIWSAGCASGEEAHTLGVLAYEAGLTGRASILGTDISAASLRRARLATYGGFALRGAHGERMRPYLEAVGDRYRVRPEIRALSEFRRGNLASAADASDPGPESITLVVCRNVLLYFAEEAVALAAARFARALSPGGFLVTAPADPPLADFAGWSRVPGAVGVYQRTDARARVDSTQPTSLGWAHVGDALAARPLAQRDEPASIDASSVWSADPELAVPPSERSAMVAASVASPAPDAVDAKLTAAHHHELALRFLEAGDVEEALAAARRVTYLEPELAMGHFTLALVALRLGSLSIARRSYREAGRLALAADPDAMLPLGDGLRAAEIARSSARQLERLEVGR